MNRKTIMLGVAGDSASGKTTITKGIIEALGPDQVTAICCDHYHRYNREERRVRGISALHPDGNYIDIMEQHFRLLREGQPILKPVYNHKTGDFDRPETMAPAMADSSASSSSAMSGTCGASWLRTAATAESSPSTCG